MDVQRVEAERAFLLHLTQWPATTAVLGGWLKQLIDELATLVNAERGFVELYRADGGTHSVSFRCTSEEEEAIRGVTSTGIVASAIASGKTVHTPYALLDATFGKQPSVQGQRLEAVLCVPFTGLRTGVLYLEGKRGKGPFKDDDVALVEHAARFLGPVLTAGSPEELQQATDPTRPLREKLKLEGLAGRSAILARVFEQVALVAPLDITVLLTGDSGTGKTQLARAIHDNSPRREGPFVELNCAAIPESLFESELFGTREGAFTGARQQQGKVAAAEGGTLFLDELSELNLPTQSKLLQLLQSKQYYPLGSTQVATANIRLVGASNARLESLVIEKRFREDLFYRINTFTIRMPSLSERREDVAPILDALLKRVSFEHSLPALPLSNGFRVAMETMDLPGNVRQLRSRLERALIRAVGENASQVEARHIEDNQGTSDSTTFAEATRRFQRELLRRELETHAWNVRDVARSLELARSHVYNLIRSFGLSRDEK